jgi:hypothetical protein
MLVTQRGPYPTVTVGAIVNLYRKRVDIVRSSLNQKTKRPDIRIPLKDKQRINGALKI